MQWRNLAVFGAILMFMIEPALASTTTGMPWEDPLDTIMNSITGPVAMVISLLGVTVAGGMLIFGGELGEFTRRIVMLVLVIGLLVSAASILSLLYGGGSALVG
ncbi:TrbC/VirB2 family protein [Geoalkalibacter halelectricus]|jgi:type IV secretion system protein VirB2|uniref:TrbC/VirB2 family protein n=1 Tax=Geoalkalibacter halelectricus TaxID=2847045 RepID=A0ABY5ZLN2_9BACT|nr:TrbC/VirB2 family protein [Geoalkalibacter halelectricus]ELU9701965.1 TrbC/VirB2 family protein [Escherichia coli]UWZ79364.1 TrbC/VirB2 family protein [Geoalkalibacter halelectricus]